MKILVCGNLGYVGPVVCKHLKTKIEGSEIVGLDTGYFASRVSQFGRMGDTYCDQQVYKDIRDVGGDDFHDFDAVVILSAISNDPMGNKFEQVTDQINHLAVKELIATFGALPDKKIVFASSCSMYGASDGFAKTEKDAVNPLTAYAKSKVSVETELDQAALGENTIATSLRFATACGMSDRLRLDLVLNDFVASAIINKEVKILSDGSPWRPLINVKDMARAIEWALVREQGAGAQHLAINIGSNDWNYTVKDLAMAVAAKVPDCEISLNPNAQPDKRSYKVNFDLFESMAPDHQPVYTLERTIDELIQGVSEIQHLIQGDFRSSDFVRLHILEQHLKEERLSADLRWIS